MKQPRKTDQLRKPILLILGTLTLFFGTTFATSFVIYGKVATALTTGVQTTTNQASSALTGGTTVTSSATAIVTSTLPTLTILPLIPADAKVGDQIHHPAAVAGDLNLQVTDVQPVMSAQEAMQVVTDTGYSYGLGGLYEGRPVTVTAIFGFLTYGEPGDTTGLHGADGKTPLEGPCAGWIGPCNWPVQTCQKGQCTRTDKVIPRIENRPYWILDYSNVVGPAGTGCPGCPEPPINNHAVIAVDVLDRFVFAGWGYKAP